jgi:hypothetical protein
MVGVFIRVALVFSYPVIGNAKCHSIPLPAKKLQQHTAYSDDGGSLRRYDLAGDYLDLANIVMLFLLTVLVVAVKLGRNAAILASVPASSASTCFFVPPRFSLAVSNIQYLVTFAVMLATA